MVVKSIYAMSRSIRTHPHIHASVTILDHGGKYSLDTDPKRHLVKISSHMETRQYLRTASSWSRQKYLSDSLDVVQHSFASSRSVHSLC